jgi:hypothetical protein
MIPTTTRTRQKYNLPSCFGELSGDGPVSARARAWDSNCFCSAFTLPLCCCCLKTVTQDTAASVTGNNQDWNAKTLYRLLRRSPGRRANEVHPVVKRCHLLDTRRHHGHPWPGHCSSHQASCQSSLRPGWHFQQPERPISRPALPAGRSAPSNIHRSGGGKTTYLRHFQTSQRQLTTAEREVLKTTGCGEPRSATVRSLARSTGESLCSLQ